MHIHTLQNYSGASVMRTPLRPQQKVLCNMEVPDFGEFKSTQVNIRDCKWAGRVGQIKIRQLLFGNVLIQWILG